MGGGGGGGRQNIVKNSQTMKTLCNQFADHDTVIHSSLCRL